MRSEISFCPLCAGKLEEEDGDQFRCLECESEFLIQLVDDDDEDEDEDEEEEEDDDRDEDDDEDEEAEEDDEY